MRQLARYFPVRLVAPPLRLPGFDLDLNTSYRWRVTARLTSGESESESSPEVQPANGMVAPETPPSTSRGSGPATVVLEKKPNRALVGWRGHQWNVSRRPRNHH